MKFEVLITTMNKTRDDITKLYRSMNISCDALFANQCGKNEEYEFEIDTHKIRVISTNIIGVSKNRNILLDNCYGDICICIDDDCSLIDDYENIILSFLDKHSDAEFVSFNGFYKKHNNREVNKHKSCKVKRYNQISYAGAPGVVFKKDAFKKYSIHFRENLGTPNEICAGEDSMFFYDLLKASASIYRCSELLFSINNDDLDSSYYKGVDKRYVKTRGFITYLLHKKLYSLYMIRHVIRFHKQDKSKSYSVLFSWFKEGVKECKK